MMMRRTLLTVALTVWTCAACSGDPPVDIGDHVTGSKLSDYAGTWDGYAEAFTFYPSGSERLRITIDETGQGSIEFGDEPLLPPPTDADVGYPADLSSRFPSFNDTFSAVTSGFRYPLRVAGVELDHLSFGVSPVDAFAAWCALQTPVPIAPIPPVRQYACAHTDWGRDPPSASGECVLRGPDYSSVVIDCTKLFLCESPLCVCSESACAAQQPSPSDKPGHFIVQLSGNLEDRGTKLVGTLVHNKVRATVKLQRN